MQQGENDGQSPNENDNGGQSPNDNENGLAALWQEEPLKQEQINTFLDHISDWGQMPAELVERIHIARQGRVKAMDVFRGFQAETLGTKRVLTRTRPNRRTGYLQMGSRRTYTARVLVAIDVSCSIRNEDLERFYATVNHLFRHQVAQLDVCTFDTVVSEPEPMQHTAKNIQIAGRGGTDYQPVLDLVEDGGYDSLIILTDGLAPVPHWRSGRHARLLWVLISPNQMTQASALAALGKMTTLI